jgi:hypothetical protein
MSTDGKDDLAIIHPKEFSVTIRGEKIVLHEYGFFEDLELRPYSQPFINDLIGLIQGEEIELNATEDLLIKHVKSVQTMIAASASKSVDWVRSLDRKEGSLIYNAWWGANGPFFVRCASDSLRSDLVNKTVAGLMYGQPSSPTGTTKSESVNTPTDS